MENLSTYLVMGAAVAYFFWRWRVIQNIKQQLPDLVQRGALIVDVRSRAEFEGGHARGSVNFPLDDLTSNCDSLDRNRPILLCCASGGRSGMAAAILKAKGFKEVYNAGAWTNLQSVARS